MSTAPHPAADLPDPERIEYLTVVASFAFADQQVDEQELSHVRELCKALALSDDGTAAVVAAATQPDAKAIDAIVARIKKNLALRVSLLTDAIVIVFADGKVDAAESRDIARLGRALDVETAQIGLIARYVESVTLGHAGEPDEQAMSRALGEGVAAELGGDAGQGAAIRWLHKIFRR